MTLRIMHEIERQYLSLEAQGLIYSTLLEELVSPEIMEMAISEAVSVGQSGNLRISAEIMRTLITLIQAEKDAVNDQILIGRGAMTTRSVS